MGHLEGGVYGWFTAGLPMRGEYSTENLGRTPNAAKDAKYPVGSGQNKQ